VTGKREETTRCIFGLACEPKHQREHCGPQRIQHRATAQMIVCRLAAHRATSELCCVLSSVLTAGVHDQATRRIGTQQAVVRRRDREMPAKEIEPLSFAGVLADDEIELLAIPRRPGPSAAAVMHDVTRIARQQQDVPGLQPQRLATGQILQHGRAADDRVIGDLVRLPWPLIDPPRRAVGAAQIEPPAHRHHFEQPAEPVHGDLPNGAILRRLSI
jgi:hypothetical protein